MRVNLSVVLIPLFGIDIPASSKGIWFSSKFSGTETDDHIELVEEFRPTSLMVREVNCIPLNCLPFKLVLVIKGKCFKENLVLPELFICNQPSDIINPTNIGIK